MIQPPLPRVVVPQQTATRGCGPLGGSQVWSVTCELLGRRLLAARFDAALDGGRSPLTSPSQRRLPHRFWPFGPRLPQDWPGRTACLAIIAAHSPRGVLAASRAASRPRLRFGRSLGCSEAAAAAAAAAEVLSTSAHPKVSYSALSDAGIAGMPASSVHRISGEAPSAAGFERRAGAPGSRVAASLALAALTSRAATCASSARDVASATSPTNLR